MRSGLRHTFRSFKVRNYRLYLIGQLISLIGNWMQVVAQDWLVLELSGNSGTALGLITALQFAPMLVFTLYGGTLADRYDKRKLLLIVNSAWLVLTLALGVLVVGGVINLTLLYVFAGVIGVVTAVEVPVRQSFYSELVDMDLLPNALSLQSTAFNLARVVGPVIAGLSIAWFGLGPVFLVNALTYAAPLVMLAMMRPGELYRLPRTGDGNGGKTRILDGLRYVWRRPDLVLPISLIFVIGMLGFNLQLTLPLVAKIVFQTGAAQFGLLTAAVAVGALAGALTGAQRRGRPSAATVIGSGAIFGAMEIVTAFAPWFWLMAVLLVPTGFFMIYFAQAANQRVQLGTEAHIRGRVMALYVLVFLGTTPIGSLLLGWLAEHAGARSSIWAGGLASVLAAGVAFMLRARLRPAEQDEAVVAGWRHEEREIHRVPEGGLREAA